MMVRVAARWARDSWKCTTAARAATTAARARTREAVPAPAAPPAMRGATMREMSQAWATTRPAMSTPVTAVVAM